VNTLHDRLKAALNAAAESTEKVAALDVSRERLTAAIEAAIVDQSAVTALRSQAAADFERFARNGGDVPEVDGAAHDAARIALVASQEKANAARAALAKIEAERKKAFDLGQSANTWTAPLASMIVLPDLVKKLADDSIRLRSEGFRASFALSEAHTLVIEQADSFKGSNEPLRHELLKFGEVIGEEMTRNRKALTDPDRNAIRAEIVQTINAAIIAAGETAK
jgi:hypothetical protein